MKITQGGINPIKVIIQVILQIVVAYLMIHALEITRTVVMVILGVTQLLVPILTEIAVSERATTMYIITAHAEFILNVNPTVLTQA